MHIEVKSDVDLDLLLQKYGKYSYFTFHINNEFTKTCNNKTYHAFENKSLIKGGYVSDSRGEFTQEKLDYIKNNDNFTLVIHPECPKDHALIIHQALSRNYISLRSHVYDKELVWEELSR